MDKNQVFKKVFKVKDGEKELDLAINKPSPAQQTEAQIKYNLAFNEAVKNKSPLRDKVDIILREQGLWSDENEKKYEELQKKILDGKLQIDKGGKISDLRKLALLVISWRNELINMGMIKSKFDSITVEGIAENARLNYLFSVCLVDNSTGRPYFSSYEEYLNSNNGEVINEGLKTFYAFVLGVDADIVEDTFERKFLKRFNMMDEKGRLIERATKRLIDEDGRYIDDIGHFVAYNEDGSAYTVDINGNKVNVQTGEFEIECQGYFEDDGQKIEEKVEIKTKTIEVVNGVV